MLEQILQDKRAEVGRLDERLLRNVRPSTRDLRLSLGNVQQQLSLFAEIKHRDPQAGDFTANRDIAAWVGSLQQLGIGALVITTESRHWGGSRDDLIALDRQGVPIPLIRNDFIIDELQLYESRAAGADAVFLRPAILDDAGLRSSLRILHSMHMTGIPLASTPAELERVLPLETPIVALCSGDPERGSTDVREISEMAARIPGPRSIVACFDIETGDAIRRLQGHVDAICLGTELLRAADPAAFLMRLIET